MATQYLLSAMEGAIPYEHLLHYREANSKLPGHPELGLTPGVKFSSGRLGHVWPWVNGIALANRDKTVFLLGSDGSQQVSLLPCSHALTHVGLTGRPTSRKVTMRRPLVWPLRRISMSSSSSMTTTSPLPVTRLST